MVKYLKKFARWYFKKASETYAWTSTATVPYLKDIVND